MTPEQLLLAVSACALPIPLESCAGFVGAVILDYESYAKKAKTTVSRLVEQYGRDGFSHRAGKAYVICAANEAPEDRRRWTIAHEIGHIACGHLAHEHAPESGKKTDEYKRKQEQEADRFAAALLAPFCLLLLCRPRSVGELSKLTGLSRQAAAIAFAGLEKFCKKDNAPSVAQKELIKNYLPFLADYFSSSSQ